MERKDGYQGKKGFHWEVVPEKKPALDKEVERFMNEEGLEKIEMTATRAGRYIFIYHAPGIRMCYLSFATH